MLDVPRAPLHPRVSPLTSPEQRSPSLRDASAALHHGLRAPPRVDAHADPPPRPVSPPLTFPDKTAAPAALARVPSASSSASASDHDVATPPAEHRITPSTVVDQLSFATSVTPSLLHAAPPEYASSSMSSAISLRHKSSQLLDTPADTQSAQCPQHSVSSSPRRPPSPKPTPDPLDSRPHHDADHSRQIEKDALGVIAAAIADGHYSLVLSTLRTQHNSHAVAVVACTFLESVCRDKRLYFDFCEEGGIEQFISAVLLFGKIDAALCTIFFHAISALSSHHDDRVSHRLRGMGVPSVVIDMLAHYRTDTAIQSAGCECLALMARSSQQSQTAIATLGGPGIVYRAITQNNCSFRDVKLARASLRAVRYIAANNEKAAEYLVQVAALDPVSSAAELFTEAGLEQDILDAMEAFSFYANGRRSIIMSSGMNALATIMLRNREPRFLVQCCNFIRAIARWNDSECESAVLQSAISERVVALMEMSNNIVGMEGARLGWYACYACTFLASFGSRTRQRLLRIGAIEGAIDVLKRRKDDAKVVHIATDALAELMKNEPAAKNLAMDYKIVGCLKEALVLHRRMGRVAKALQWTLEYLAAPEGTAFAPAHGSHIFQDLSRENSSRTDSHRNQHKSQSWKSRLSFIRSNWKKS